METLRVLEEGHEDVKGGLSTKLHPFCDAKGRPRSVVVSAGHRDVVERCVNKLKQWRGIATSYEKRAANYREAVIIAALMIWLTS